ncbi:WecB/TagA/CpsF family glycosyltransferase [Brevundimonas sp. 2R-24]|uniref:WecB/TagA/CpsF family glycosyltransferase n=1 Tax=Peiella sedimenti TaxID=3061083 RepID=A0ABT8SPK0_9CAUL|nr:WecB/TagA/CpsF family glycosyltransferase [Caulobacteraceae bacterium XZ-24]
MLDTAAPSILEQARERRAAKRRPFRRARRTAERIRLMGEAMDLVRPEEVMHHVEAAVSERRRFLVANHNLHSLYLLDRTPGLRAFYDKADLIEVDSTPLIAFSRLTGVNGKGFHRCTYLDWRPHFWSVANRLGWRVFYLGGAPGVADEAARRLKAQYPGAEIRCRNGYFDAKPGSAENAVLLDQITAFDPHILFVGMGMPRQELWIVENLKALPTCAIFSVGAAFDYEAGVQKAAPRWMGRLGLEWLFRLTADPRRLFARYCVEPWFLIPRALSDLRAAGK